MKYNPVIIKSDRKTISLEVAPDGKITLRVPSSMSYREIEKFMNRKSAWIEKTLAEYSQKSDVPVIPFTKEELEELTGQAKQYIPGRVAYYSGIMNIKYNKVTVKTVKTRWGSCSSAGNLSFNCLLMLTPPEVIDSVIIHELCHLKEMNHSKRFYNEIYKIMPDYDKYDRWLKTHGVEYIKRLKKSEM